MSKRRCLIYCLFSGLLLCLPWYPLFSGLFLLIAFIPLLQIEDSMSGSQASKTNGPVFLYASLVFFIRNAGTTWWIANASVAGALAAILISTLLFSVIFLLFHISRRLTGNLTGYIAFVAYWTAGEYLYLNAEISWPWLNLGNGFANDVPFIQWYEYTGTLGGTVWILLSDLLLFEIVKSSPRISKRRRTVSVIIASAVIILPLLFSLNIFYNYREKSDPCRVVILQPNEDPYHPASPRQQCSGLIQIAGSALTCPADYFIAPEVAIQDDIWENNIQNNMTIPALSGFLTKAPGTCFVFGAYTYAKQKKGTPIPGWAQYSETGHFLFSSYNTALQIDNGNNVQWYHKSKLVAGAEKFPYPGFFKFLQKTVETLGGTFASHGTQDYRTVFRTSGKETIVAPVICYESVYGEFVTDYIKNGATVIFILTNDGWWGNTPGYRQHLSYARLRAIETRRSIARSANTGISAIINQRGEIVSSLEWGRKGALPGTLNNNHDITFYVRHGDYIGRMACYISVCFLMITLVQFVLKRKKQ